MITPFISGLGIGAGLIIAIGAQNAFVLGQGLRRQYHIMVATICAICDILLISAGVAGVGGLISASPVLTDIMAWGGALFLGWYGFQSFKSLFSDHNLKQDKSHGKSRREVFLYTIAITLLNPHVYLDTVVLLGGIAAQYSAQDRLYFGFGAACASILWFSLISLGAAWASPYLQRPITWKIIDAVTGLMMWSIALSLVI
ncbi:MAG: LysE/ArgO family amino acid transporter [Terasakiella sp.]|uniref:LysE/ArgO family amino acid transporter n=1 Tax=unclassified Terasakiella TaxID=2614952 RepID=UPI003B00A1F2